ncbi:hypothetical protein [Nocardiopsis algeriensis]|nr:hypothetical protein [Nocardiopsis algeriensis]
MSAFERTHGAPADGRSTFLQHVLSLFDEHGEPPWPDGGRPFPDDLPGWANVAMSSVFLDGVRTHHSGIDADTRQADTLVEAIARAVKNPVGTAVFQHLHDVFAGTDALTVADHFADPLAERKAPPARVRELARWIAEYGTDRNALKIALVLLGLCGDERERDLLVLLGSLDEFALYAAVALWRAVPDPEPDLFLIARRTTGWGRIHAVKRLRGAADPAIRAWLLREGFRNGVMDSYLAHFVAVNFGLVEALTGEGPEAGTDEVLLDGAGRLLSAMAMAEGGVAEGLADYPGAFTALERYAELVEGVPAPLGRLADLTRIRLYLLGIPGDLGRPAEEVARLGRRFSRLLEHPEWTDLVRAHLADPEREDFGAALWPAHELGLRPFDDVLRRLRVAPRDAAAWAWAFRWASSQERATGLVELDETLLPLDRLDTGPTDVAAVGPGYEDEQVLEQVLRCMARIPGSGRSLVRVGLRNRCVAVRASAVRVLEAWQDRPLSVGIVSLLRSAVREEPDPKIRKRMELLLERLGFGSEPA